MGDSVLAVMGDVHGLVIADLFAGDGYYTEKLLDAGARVLAIDDDPAKVAALKEMKQRRGLGDDRLIIRLTSSKNPGLLPNEADAALLTREISTIVDRDAWFKQLTDGLKDTKRLYVVNFLPVDSPVGPPMEQRMDYSSTMDELNTYGFTDVGVLYKKVPYRFIIFAAIPPEGPA